jgi:predicted Zn-dependent peptidase
MIRRTFLVAAIVAVTADPFGWAQKNNDVDPFAPTAAADPVIEHEAYKLDNGLEVILVPDKTMPLVAVSVWYHVGAGFEVVGKSGFAHLFEHMLFQGSQHVGADKHFDILKKVGSSTQNGTTNSDRTNYFEVVPSNQLETALWLESDRMGYLLPLLTETSLKNQIDVVRNERRQRIDNVPYGPSGLKMSELLYPEGHPDRYQTIGRHEDLESAKIEDVRDFYKTWYVPGNATIAIAGDFDVDATKALITKWFGSFPKSERPEVVTVPAPTVARQYVELTDKFAKLRQVTFAWHSPGNFRPGDADLDLAASILGGGDASRLNKLLVVDRQLAQSVRASQGSQQFSGVFSVTVTLRGEADLATVEELVEAEVARLTTEPVTQRELDRAVVRQEAAVVYRLEDLLARTERLQAYNHYLGDPDKLTWDLDRYRRATPDSLRDQAKKYLSPKHMVELVTLPRAGGDK